MYNKRKGLLRMMLAAVGATCAVALARAAATDSVSATIDTRTCTRTVSDASDVLPITYSGSNWGDGSGTATVTYQKDGGAAQTLVTSTGTGAQAWTPGAKGLYVFKHASTAAGATDLSATFRVRFKDTVTVTVPAVSGAYGVVYANGEPTAPDCVPVGAFVRVIYTAAEGLAWDGARRQVIDLGLVTKATTVKAPGAPVAWSGKTATTTAVIDTRTEKHYVDFEGAPPIWFAAGANVSYERAGADEATELVEGAAPDNAVWWAPTLFGAYDFTHSTGGLTGRIYFDGVEIQPVVADNSTANVYTNNAAVELIDEKYTVATNEEVVVVFNADTGYFFKESGIYTPVKTNTIDQAATNPIEVTGPEAFQGTKCGTEVWGFKNGGVLTLVGTGATASGSKNNPFRGDSLTSVVIQPGVTEIGQYFFKNCTHLNSVTGGKDLATVGNQAFFGCMSLETITLDGNMPAGMDQAVVYKTAIKPSGETYDIPDIKVKNYVKALFGAKDAKNPEWVNLGSPEDKSIYETEYNFFQIRLVPEK